MQEYQVKVCEDQTVWYQNGKPHRLDGPAFEYANGSRSWCQNGVLHRLDGPAIENCNGYKTWWIEGTQYSEEEFLKKTQKHKVELVHGLDLNHNSGCYCKSVEQPRSISSKHEDITCPKCLDHLHKTQKHTVTFDGKTIKISQESYNEFKKLFKEN